MTIFKRNSDSETYHLRKRVPVRFKNVELRKHVGISLHTDSLIEAQQKAIIAWQQLLAGWEARLAGDTKDAEKRFIAAKQLAKARNYRFFPAEQIAILPANDLSERITSASKSRGHLDKLEASAILGGINPPEINVSRALELFWSLAAEKTLGKSEGQIRRWRNPYKKAIANFLLVVGDKALSEISRDDMLEFRQWWFKQMKNNGLTANSANKDLIYLGSVLKTVNEMKGLNIDLPLFGLRFKEGEVKQRPSFSKNWISEKLLAKGALDKLNLEARCIILGMINTGYRPSEAQGLLAKHIKLDCEIPHISIEPDGRQLKSVRSRRIIPLAGVSLEAFKLCTNGFPRYKDNSSLSGTVNRFLRENDLLETPEHSLYGLRHSFEDRMLAAGVDERIRRDLFGHRLNRERYGAGATLEHLHKIIQLISL
jgi:integrase